MTSDGNAAFVPPDYKNLLHPTVPLNVIIVCSYAALKVFPSVVLYAYFNFSISDVMRTIIARLE